MSERLLRHQLEQVYGVRRAVHVRGTRTWRVTVYTMDPSQREADIARRVEHLGRVSSCTLLAAGDPKFRKFAVVLVVADAAIVATAQTAAGIRLVGEVAR